MAKKIEGYIKLQIAAGKATPAPPVGPALGQHGVNIVEFTKQFNAKTADMGDTIVPTVITVYADRSFSFITKTPPAPVLIKKACKIQKASGEPNKNKVAKITRAQLEEIAAAMEKTANEVGVKLVAGDTKVTGKGQCDGVFINTTGVGEILPGTNLSGANAKPGDKIIVTGDVGRHGCTILLARDEYGIEADVTSDCAPLYHPVRAVLKEVPQVHVIRDATRGGVGTVLYEIASESNIGVCLDHASIPVDPAVSGVTGMLGLEPLYLACEGRLVMIAPAEGADQVVSILQKQPYTEGA